MPSSMNQFLHKLKKQLEDVLAQEKVEQDKASAALKLLQRWRNIKSCISKGDTTSNNTQNTKTNYRIAAVSSNINISINNTSEDLPSISTLKRTFSDFNDCSVQSSWNSSHKVRKTKHLKIYLSTSYGKNDFGEDNEWTVDDINMTKAFKEFRERSIKGAQLRKSPSDQRILSLSFIFLISRESRVLSNLTSVEKASILKGTNLKGSWRPIEEEVTLVCHKIHKRLQEDDISHDAATDAIDSTGADCKSVAGKATTRIISSLLYRFMNWCEN